MSLVTQTAKCSLFIQVIFTCITGASLFFDYPPEYETVKQIVILETVSQIIEFCYYLYVVYRIKEISTWTRYLDWIFSTPIMLVSTMGCLLFQKDESSILSDVFSDNNIAPTIIILVSNWVTLLFGFLAETDIINRFIGVTAGMFSFFATFAVLFANYVRGSGSIGISLFLFTYVVWGMYGVAALQEYTVKNIAYNLLDIVSKNVYGLFLFIYTLTLIN